MNIRRIRREENSKISFVPAVLPALLTLLILTGCNSFTERSVVIKRDAGMSSVNMIYEDNAAEDADDALSGEKIGDSYAAGADADDALTEEAGTGNFRAEELDFDIEEAYSYCEDMVCRYLPASKLMLYELSFNDGIPVTDDDNVYLFEIATYESENSLKDKTPICSALKATDTAFVFEYEQRYLFAGFVPALLFGGEYIPIATQRCISNPEALADNKDPYPVIESKKGLLLDANTIGRAELTDLNVKRIVFNIPLSYIMGPSTNSAIDTVSFDYNGRTYDFDGYRLAGFDLLFKYLTENGYHTTAIVLNDWNTLYPEIIHPKSRHKTGQSMYYAFNTEEEEGVRLMEAAALFLSGRYSGVEYGMIHDWVIANEVNQQTIWNYMATDNLCNYTEAFEKSFRTFYNAIKSNYANAHVYFSVDHDWNDNGGNNGLFFNARDFLYEFNKRAKLRGDYDWCLSVHPYPAPLTKVKFWKGDYDKSEEAAVLTPMNLSSLTEVMTKEDFLNTKGEVRDIGVTEVGFSSKASEKLQAAAFAYSYYIIEDNEYICSYLLNRQTDDTESLKSGLAIGIYNNDYSPKYIKEIYANIDSKAGEDYIPEMLEVIGADSLEEALDAAR